VPGAHAARFRIVRSDDVATHAPTDLCKNYQPADAGAAYRGCEVRPLELCRLPNPDDAGEFVYVDAGPQVPAPAPPRPRARAVAGAAAVRR
jgi:hypothetical protein